MEKGVRRRLFLCSQLAAECIARPQVTITYRPHRTEQVWIDMDRWHPQPYPRRTRSTSAVAELEQTEHARPSPLNFALIQFEWLKQRQASLDAVWCV
jgi:hypothetical protein